MLMTRETALKLLELEEGEFMTVSLLPKQFNSLSVSVVVYGTVLPVRCSSQL